MSHPSAIGRHNAVNISLITKLGYSSDKIQVKNPTNYFLGTDKIFTKLVCSLSFNEDAMTKKDNMKDKVGGLRVIQN